jgi:WD40 repeat protein
MRSRKCFKPMYAPLQTLRNGFAFRLVTALMLPAMLGCQRKVDTVGTRFDPDQQIPVERDVLFSTFSANGQRAALGHYSGPMASIVDIGTGRVESVSLGGRANVWSLALAADGTRLAIGSGNHGVQIWDVTAKSLVRAFPHADGDARTLAFSPSGTQVYKGSHDPEGTVRRLDLKSGESAVIFREAKGKLVRPNFVSSIYALAVSPDGHTLAIGLGHGTVLFDLAGRKEVFGLKSENYGSRIVVFSQDGKVLAVAGGAEVELWDPKTGARLAGLRRDEAVVGGRFSSVAFSPDQRLLAAGLATYTHGPSYVMIWRLSGRGHLTTFLCHQEPVCGIGFLPEGRKLATASHDGTIRVWNLKNVIGE